MTQKKPHWAVYLLASVMGLVFLICMGLMVASEWSEAKKAEWHWGFVGLDGAVVIPLELEGARRFQNGRAAAKRDGLWGFVDRSGAFVVPPRFNQLCDYGGADLTCAEDTEARDWGYIDDAGDWALPPTYHRAHPMVDGVAVIGEVVGRSSTRIGNSTSEPRYNYGLIARDGSMIVPILPDRDPGAWTSTGAWSEGRMDVQIDRGKFGYVDKTGTMVLEPVYRAARPFQNGFAAVSGSGGWAVIDSSGNLVIPEANGLASGASEGLIAGPTGYYTLEGVEIGPRFEWVRSHAEGLGAVHADRKWGFVDTAIEQVIPFQFPRVSDFADGRAVAAAVDGLNYRWGVIDRTGAWVVEPTWRGVDESGFAEGLLPVGNPPEEL